jgi:hypothetical protein
VGWWGGYARVNKKKKIILKNKRNKSIGIYESERKRKKN